MSWHDCTVWTEEGVLRWRDWLVDNCPDDVLGPQARNALRELPKERVSAYLKYVSNTFDSCGPLDFFRWTKTHVPSAPEDDGERHKFWDKVNDEVAAYLRTWYGSGYAVMELVIQQHQ